MKCETIMASNLSWRKELKNLKKRSVIAENANDYQELAKLCNIIGELHSQNGLYEEAISHHKEEIHYSEAISDWLGAGIGNRKVGECFAEIQEFEKALYHEKLHLQAAKKTGSIIEEQRALATIGRTYFLQVDWVQDSTDVIQKSLESYLESLDLCDQLKGTISDKDWLESKARLYLNIGLVYDIKQDYDLAISFVKKALIVSREQCFKDNVFRCLYSLSGITLKFNQMEYALKCARDALQLGKEIKNTQLEADAIVQLGLVFTKLQEYSPAIHSLRKGYKLSLKHADSDGDAILAALKQAVKGRLLTKEISNNTKPFKLMKLHESLGDYCSELKLPQKAIEHYKKQLELAIKCQLEKKSLARIHYSLGITYNEANDPSSALKSYEAELMLRQGDYKEQCLTLLAIAKTHIEAESDLDIIKEVYNKAIEYSQKSGNNSVMKKVYIDYKEFLKNEQFPNDHQNFCVKFEIENINDDDDEDESEESNSQVNNDDDEKYWSDSYLNVSDSEGDLSDADEEHNEGDGTVRRKRHKSSKLHKLNERGETPLHVACISGDLKQVKSLLEKGANVQFRDYCGWQPLHEACNHGHADIAACLLDYGADVNDHGGAHCQGITPLHDASQNGHIDVVKLLVDKGADLSLKNKEGHTAITLVQMAIRADEAELDNSELLSNRRAVLKHLQNATPITRQQQRPNFIAMKQRSVLDNLADIVDSEEQNSEEIPDFNYSFSLPNNDEDDNCDDDIDSRIEPRVSCTSAFVSDNSDSDFDTIISETTLDNTKKTKPRITETHKSKPRAKEKGTLQIFHGVERSPKRKRRKKQSRIDDKFSIEIFDDDSSLDIPSSPIGALDVLPDAVNTSMTSSLPKPRLRINVKVLEYRFIVPCSRDGAEKATILWLINEAASRYHALMNVRPHLFLETKDGSRLSDTDLVSDVLCDNETVIAKIQSWLLAPAEDRYKEACSSRKINFNSSILTQLSNVQLVSIDLTDASMDGLQLESFAEAVRHCATLVSINLSRNNFGDIGMSYLTSALCSIPLLSSVSLDCVGMTTNGLSELAKSLENSCRKIQDHPNPSFVPSWHSLSLAFNDFSHQHTGTSLSVIIKTLANHLQVLNIENVELEAKLFSAETELRSSLRVCKSLTTLNIAGNELTTTSLRLLIDSLPSASLNNVNLNYTLPNDDRALQFCPSFSRLFEVDQHLKIVALNGLSLGKNSATNLAKYFDCLKRLNSLQELSLADNDFNGYCYVQINCALRHMKLKRLDLSGNQMFETEKPDVILNTLSTMNSFQHLDLSRCEITSPLSKTILLSIRNYFENKTETRSLELSCNLLNLDEHNEIIAMSKSDTISIVPMLKSTDYEDLNLLHIGVTDLRIM